MAKASLAVRIDSKTLERLRRFCAARGIKQSFFVQSALREQLKREELLDDLLDFEKKKPQEKVAISFEEYLRMRDV